MKRIWLAAALMALLALGLGWWSMRPPAALGTDAPAERFSAGRAMQTLAEIARAPHPSGSAEHRRVFNHLSRRMGQLGLETGAQGGPMSQAGAARYRRWFGEQAQVPQALNLIGVLPGTDRSLPAVVIMAHYDTVPGSPGAGDDSSGVAAALEAVRAVKAQGPTRRDIIVLLTDGEELNLEGARLFFAAHPLRSGVGAVINLEARGSGRVLMFETGPEAGALADLYAREVERPSAHSMAAAIYSLMPNDTDFSIPREAGIGGYNLAFTSGPETYHSPSSTVDRVDPGSIQHMGDHATALLGAMARAEALPAEAPNKAYADVFGLMVIYPAWVGWLLLGLAAVLGVAAARRLGLRVRDAAPALWFPLWLLLNAALLHRLMDATASGGAMGYYDRLGSMGLLGLMAGGVTAAGLLAGPHLTGLRPRWIAAAVVVLLGAATAVLSGDLNLFQAVLTLLAAGVWLIAPRHGHRREDGWRPAVGAVAALLLLATALQALLAPAAYVLAWPALIAALMLAAAAFLDPRLDRPWTPWMLAVIGGVAAAWIVGLYWMVFINIGFGLPEAMAVFALILAGLIWPVLARLPRRAALGLAAVAVGVAVCAAVVERLDGVAPTVPTYQG
ncbi:M20/M25/M40 family metallo-hydrolase [Brevundimonas sp. 2R-24]|uniref:Vacuolar membrane protease n=1 Tax=Peiella sedimenti TaxID=3061083 RepID=A0ABT8SHN1_9CAUL|nr:M20/M25/M40 family metallo-hydrolase [Caulobacteraceae bacterium XZ-24]